MRRKGSEGSGLGPFGCPELFLFLLQLQTLEHYLVHLLCVGGLTWMRT